MKKLSDQDLKQGDGSGDNPTLVAVDGKVYDVTASKMWKDGRHVRTHQAGQDLSLALQAAPHGPDVLERFDQVGELAAPGDKQEPQEFPEPGPLVGWVLKQHPHPVLSHFPIGLGVAASLFALGALLLDVAGMGQAAMWNLFFTAAAAPFAIAAGLLSWHYNYGGIWTPIFRAKAILSLLLLLVVGAALMARLVFLADGAGDSTWQWIYRVALLAVAPVVVLIGRLGGKVTFPS
jgi:predicted heme/steroid binding protein/uncharacterized membrane protein